ncbi:D-alanyl-D-alanine carboxypeptidase family protein [Treponema phagedenis]|uniref:D-alanyl-D-alanine carboxypeptidase family protein n=1 Tax=Treponema phagedenis TaxID=162 RepID=UPI0011E6137D|nr:D-alanyl-D-alanine carboxypeptidase family protein [Treponema phagedenis]QEK01413.1 D-alanyl-D-alanine carboxypeptidase [Treponema phagedenis]QEK06432.1 D-alanyl-D-alanine carboxypeptidase [Treponema phagedenis]QSH93720.1 D-alanyl-D-alanine carboxypeptidase [Treponema phagedenis]
MQTGKKRSLFYFFLILVVVVFWTSVGSLFLFSRAKKLQSHTALPLSAEEQGLLLEDFYAKYKVEGTPQLANLCPAALMRETKMQNPAPILAAQSVIVANADTGQLLYEYQADRKIPPASLTKLVAMYVAMQAIDSGEITLDQVVVPPRESWAENIPPGSSLLFLGPNQQLTVSELLRGMAVVSGNDAAIALAHAVSGSVPKFVERMNQAVKTLGLKHTVFTEPSGLSEENYTTARDFARFCLVYLREYPKNLERFHALQELTYPLSHNVKNLISITQPATNTLLGKLKGCDGLKTGFIYESGFNIALTCKRAGTRILAVILGGAGKTIAQGRAIREKDGEKIMNWAFHNFQTYPLIIEKKALAQIPVIGAARQSSQASVYPIIVFGRFAQNKTTVFRLNEKNTDNSSTELLHLQIHLPKQLYAPLDKGEVIGTAYLMRTVDGKEFPYGSFPLIADRDVSAASDLSKKLDILSLKLFGK